MITCDECGEDFEPATDSYTCPHCGAEDNYPDDIPGEDEQRQADAARLDTKAERMRHGFEAEEYVPNDETEDESELEGSDQEPPDAASYVGPEQRRREAWDSKFGPGGTHRRTP